MRALVAIVMLASATAARAQEIQVKLGTLAPEGSPWHAIIRDMAEAWKQGTGGKARFRIYPGGVAGDEPDMVRKMRIGQIHAAALTGVGLSEIVAEVGALQMPMMFRDYEELDTVVERMAPKLEALLREKGFVVLNWGDAGWVHFFAQSPVVTIDDLRKEKLFVWATSTAEVGVWKDAGCRPVPLAATEIHTGLKSGLISAFSTTPLAALSYQWFGSAKNMTDLRWAPLIGATVITKKKWDEFAQDLRPTLVRASSEAGAKMKADVRKMGGEAVEVMKKHGLTVHAVSESARAQWEEQARAAWPKLAKGATAELVREVEQHIREFREKREKK